MPLNSTTGFPTSSKLIEKKWEERRMRLHAQKIHDVQPLVKTAPPKVYPHMILRLKKIQSEEQKQAEIDKDNQILLQRMTWILKRKGQVDNWNDYRRMSMNKLVREREQQQIAEKNLGIAKKLESVRPYYNVSEWEEEYEKRALLQGQWNKSTKDYESTPRTSMASRRSYETLPPLDKKSEKSDKRGPWSRAKSESTSSSVTKLPKLMGNGSTKYPREYNTPRKGRRRTSSRLSESEEDTFSSSKDSSRSSSPHSSSEQNSSDSETEESKAKKAKREKAKKKKSLIEKERMKQKLKEEKKLRKQREEKKKQKEEEKRKQKEEEEKRKRKEEEEQKRKQKEEEERKHRERERLKKKQQEEKLKQKQKEEEKLKQKQKEEEEKKKAERAKQKEKKQKEEEKQNQKVEDVPDDNIKPPSIHNSDGSDSEEEEEGYEEEVFDARRIHSVKKDKRLRSSREDDPRVFSGVMVTEGEAADSADKSDKDKESTDNADKDTADKGDEPLSDTGGTEHESGLESDGEAMEEDNMDEDEEGLDEDSIADQDAKLLFRAVKNLSKPEDMVVKTLIRRSPKQRMLTKEKFEDLYEMSLGTELKKVLGSAHFTLIDCLLGVKTKSDTTDIHNALKAKDIAKLVDLLSSKSSASLAASTTSYKKDYDVSLEQDIRDKISDEDCQNLLVALLSERPSTETVDEDIAARDAEQLSEAGEGRFSNENGKFILLVKERSPAQLTATLTAYKQLSGGGDINELLEEDGCSKSFVTAVKALDKSAGMGSSQWAEQIHAQLKPNNADLISTMLDRNDQEMTSIRKSYRKKYAGELTDDIVAKCGNAGPLIAHVAARGGVTPAPGTKQPRPPPGEKPKRVNGMRVPSPPKKAPLKGFEPKSPEFGKDNPFQEPQRRPIGDQIRQNAKEKLDKKPPANKGNKTDRDGAKKKGSAGSSRSKTSPVHSRPSSSQSEDPSPANDSPSSSKSKDPSPVNDRPSSTQSKGPSPVNDRPSSNQSKGPSPVNDRPSSGQSKGPSPVNVRPSSSRSKGPSPANDRPSSSQSKGPSLANDRPSSSQSKGPSPVNDRPSSSQSKGPSPVNDRPSSSQSKGPSPVNDRPSSGRSKGPSPANDRPRSSQSKVPSPVNDRPSSSQSKGPSPADDRPSSSRSKGPSPVNSEPSTPTKAVGKAGKGYNADEDVKKIKEAMKGWGTDEEPLIQIFSGRTNEQRQQIRKKYQEKYKSDLLEDLKAELSGDLEEAVLALMMAPGEYDAYCLHDALTGVGTSEAVLIGILSTRNAKELKSISVHYEQQYDDSLVEVIESDTSGALGELLGRLVRGERDQGSSVDQQLVDQDAEELYQDGATQIKLDDETFKDVMTRRNRHHVRAVFDKYKQLSGRSIDDVIKNSFAGDAEDGYLGLAQAIQSPSDFYANRIHSAMAGVGTNDQTLIRILVSRSEVDLTDIKARYKALYNQTLDEAVDDECSGDYKKLLLALIKDKGTEKPKPTPTRKARSQERRDESRDRRASPAVSKATTVSNQSKGKAAASPKTARRAETKKNTTPKREKPSPGRKPVKNTPVAKSQQKPATKGGEKAKDQDSKKKPKVVSKDKDLDIERSADKIAELTREEELNEERSEKKDNETSKKDEEKVEEESQLVPRPPTATIGTITGHPDADVNSDVTELEKALAGWNDDEEALIRLLSNRTSKQRLALRAKYKEKHSKELLDVIRSELKGDFEEAVDQMLSSPHELLTKSLHDSIESITEDNCLLNGLLVLSSQKEIDAVNSKYSEVYKTSFLADAKKAGAQAAYVNVLEDMLCGSRDQTYDVDEDGGKQDAVVLYNDGEHALKLRDDTFKALLTKSNRSQVRFVCGEFKKLAEEDIVEGIKWAMIVRCLRDPVSYFAEHLHDAMAGLGTNGTKLISIIVSRSEIDLHDIKGRYKELYSKELAAAVSSECSGDYTKMLLAVLSGGDTTTINGGKEQVADDDTKRLEATLVSPASNMTKVDITSKPQGIYNEKATKTSPAKHKEKASKVKHKDERSPAVCRKDSTKDIHGEVIATEETETKSEPASNDSVATQLDENSVRASWTDEEGSITAQKNAKGDQEKGEHPEHNTTTKEGEAIRKEVGSNEQVSEDTAQNTNSEKESSDKDQKASHGVNTSKGGTGNNVGKKETIRPKDKPRPRLREQYSQTELGIIENEIGSINSEVYQMCVLQDDLLGMILKEDPEKNSQAEDEDTVAAAATHKGENQETNTGVDDPKKEKGQPVKSETDGKNGNESKEDQPEMVPNTLQEGKASTAEGKEPGVQEDLSKVIQNGVPPKEESTAGGKEDQLQVDDLLQKVIEENQSKEGEITNEEEAVASNEGNHAKPNIKPETELANSKIENTEPGTEASGTGTGDGEHKSQKQDDLLQMILNEDQEDRAKTPQGRELKDDLLQMIINEDIPKGESMSKGQEPQAEDLPTSESSPKGQDSESDYLPKGDGTPKGKGPNLQDDLLQMIIDEDTPTVKKTAHVESKELNNDPVDDTKGESEGGPGATNDKEDEATANILSGIIIDNAPEQTLGDNLLELILDGNSPLPTETNGQILENDDGKTGITGCILTEALSKPGAGIADCAMSSAGSSVVGGELNEDLLQKVLNGELIVEAYPTSDPKDETHVSGRQKQDHQTTLVNMNNDSDEIIESKDNDAETGDVSKSTSEGDVANPGLQDDLLQMILAENEEAPVDDTVSQTKSDEPLEGGETSNLGDVLMGRILTSDKGDTTDNNGEQSSDGKDEGIEVDAESKEESSEGKEGEVLHVDDGKPVGEQAEGNNVIKLGNIESKREDGTLTKVSLTEGSPNVDRGSSHVQRKDSVITDSGRPTDPMCSNKQEEMEKKSNTVRKDTVDNMNPEMLQQLKLEMNKWQPDAAANADVLEENGEEAAIEGNEDGDDVEEEKGDKIKVEADDCAVGKDECTSTDDEVPDNELYGDDWDDELVAVVDQRLDRKDTVTNMIPPEDMLIINQDTIGGTKKQNNLKIEEISLGGDSGIGNGADDIGNGSGKVEHIAVDTSIDKGVVHSLVETIIENSVNEYTSHRCDVNAVGNT